MKKFATLAVVAIVALATGYLLLRAADKPAPVQAPTVPIKSVTAESIAKLEMNAGVDEKTKLMTYAELMKHLSEKTGLNIRMSEEYFRSTGDPALVEVLKIVDHFQYKSDDTVRKVLERVSDRFSYIREETYQDVHYSVYGKDVVVAEGFRFYGVPLGFTRPTGGGEPMVPDEIMIKRLHGKTMTFAVADMTLDAFVELVRERTGANVVIDRGNAQPGSRKVNLILSCVSTLNALRLAAEFEDLYVTCIDNIYVTGIKEKIDKLNNDLSKSIYVKELSHIIHVPVDQDGKITNTL
jgi:hypothetical protein